MPGQVVPTWTDHTPATLDLTCGFCRTAVQANRIGQSVETGRKPLPQTGQESVTVTATFLCPRSECGRPSFVLIDFITDRGDVSRHSVVGQMPRGQAQELDDLPGEVAADRLEAWSCFYGGDYRAAVIMGRAAIQRAVRTLEATGAGLKAEIADLAGRGVVTKSVRESADEVRIAGDDAAHPEELGTVTREDAEESLAFLDEFLRHTFVMPAKQARLKAARQARANS